MCLVAQSCPPLCDPLDCSPPGSSVHGIFRPEWWSGLTFPPPEYLPCVSYVSCIAGRFFIPSYPPRSSESNRLSYLHQTAHSHWLCISHTVRYMFQCNCPTLTFSRCVHKSVLYVCGSIAALQINSPVPWKGHIYVLTHTNRVKLWRLKFQYVIFIILSYLDKQRIFIVVIN